MRKNMGRERVGQENERVTANLLNAGNKAQRRPAGPSACRSDSADF